MLPTRQPRFPRREQIAPSEMPELTKPPQKNQIVDYVPIAIPADVRVYLCLGDAVMIKTFFTSCEIYDFVENRWANVEKKKKYGLFTMRIKFDVVFEGRVLSRRHVGLAEYNIHTNSTIHVRVRSGLLGGNIQSINESVFSHPNKNEEKMSWKQYKAMKDRYKNKMQNLKRDRLKELYRSQLKNQSGYTSLASILSPTWSDANMCGWTEKLENYHILVSNLVDAFCYVPRSRLLFSLTTTLMTHYKLMTKKTFHGFMSEKISDLAKYLVTFSEQSGFEETTTILREGLDYWPRLKNSPLWKKIRTVVVFMSLYTTTGDCDLKRAKLVESAQTSVNTGDMVYAIADLLIFLAERGYQIFKTGSIDPIFHSGGTYEMWYQESVEVLSRVQFLHNPEPHGIDIHKTLAELDDLILKGKNIHKFACELDKYAKKIVGTTLERLIVAKANHVNVQFAQQTRKAPFAVLVEGQSSIGKTTFATMLHYFFGVVMQKDVSPGSRYTVNPGANFMDGFTTSMWSILLDDIACYNVNKMSEIDPTLRNMLLFNNNTPHMPDQAEIGKKGQTPMRCDLLVATTNVPELNLDSYFAVPFAVARRFPYHFRLKPKSEFRKESDPKMLDSAKVPCFGFGEYPDLWEIEVYEPKSKAKYPDPTLEWCQVTELLKTHTFTNTPDFLSWLGPIIQNHDKIQSRVVASEGVFAHTQICKNCFKTSQWCECIEKEFLQPRLDVKFQQQFGVEMLSVWSSFVMPFLSSCFGSLIGFMMSFQLVRVLMYRYVGYYRNQITYGHEFARMTMHRLGEKVKSSFKTPETYVKLALVATSLLGAYKLYTLYKGSVNDEQFGMFSLGTKPTVSDERESVWKNDYFTPSHMDLGKLTKSWSNQSREFIEDALLKNSVFLRFEDGNKWRVSKALGLCGQYYITTNHSIPEFTGILKCSLQRDSKSGINGNYNFSLTAADLQRDYENDFVIIRIRSSSPQRDITELFMKDSYGKYHGKGGYVGRSSEGHPIRKSVRCITQKEYNNTNLCIRTNVFFGLVDEPTIAGDCGMTLLVETGQGFMIAGIHQLGAGGADVGALRITFEMIEKYLDRNQITDPNLPMQDASFTQIGAVGELHFKSPVRFIEQGVANVFGSYSGFRSEPKSLVQKTLMYPAMEKRGFECKFAAPVMKGWRPWRVSLLETVTTTDAIDTRVVDDCVSALVNDWLTVTPEWKEELTMYDMNTVINGKPGMRFVDSINRQTSAGFPYRCSKQFLSVALPKTEEYPQAITFKDEILERTNTVLQNWSEGRRAGVVFTAALKDEALKLAKVEEARTRVFMGSSIEMTLAMRMVLLSFTRVVQKNKFIFEQFPGTEAQSVEWDFIRDYLTKHGEERCVFGDFRGFDKSMSSTFILAAFEAIAVFHEKCGVPEIQVRMIRSLAYDVCFAYVDFNGDLIEFFGINPSGQALTVIINGIVNCLYLRYVYYIRNPMKECRSFKSKVNLATYGDDNGMNVHESVDFFNHTVIMDTLATIGVTYTMADKDSESVPFIHFNEGSFLKRTWRYEPEFGTYVCPLEEASLIKSLMIGVKSKALIPEVHACEIAKGVCQEYFWYGRSVFENKRELILDILTESGCIEYLKTDLPHWEDLCDQYIHNSKTFLKDTPVRPYGKKVYKFE